MDSIIFCAFGFNLQVLLDKNKPLIKWVSGFDLVLKMYVFVGLRFYYLMGFMIFVSMIQKDDGFMVLDKN